MSRYPTYVRELVVSYRATDIPLTKMLRTPRDIVEVASRFHTSPGVPWCDEPVEVFGVLCLNTRHQLLGVHALSRGTIDAALVHPREVFKASILANAACVIAVHNHPSGDATASKDDDALLERLIAVGTILGIEVLDGIILGHDGQYDSARGRGILGGQW